MISFRWLLLQFIFWQISAPPVKTIWPSLNSSTIQLLGLFSDAINATETTPMSVHSRAMFKAAILLSRQYNITIDGKYLDWQTIQTGGNAMNALSSTCRIIPDSNIVGIVGPAFSREVQVIAGFGETINIPVISYSATNPDLSDRSTYPAFYRTVSTDSAAAVALVKLFHRYNWTSCLIIYQNDAFGSGAAKIISETFNHNGLTVTEMIIFDIVSLTIRGDLKSMLLTSSTRIVIAWADQIHAPLLLEKALDSDVLGPQFTWIMSESDPFRSFNLTAQQKLIGMLSIEPVTGSITNALVNDTLLNAAYSIWQQYEPETFPGTTALDYYALFAFDATWVLIQALQQFCSTMSNNSLSCISFINTSYCFDHYLLNGKKFIDTISTTKLLGVSGLVTFASNVTDRMIGNYYVVKNAQPTTNGVSAAPVLVWSDSNDWKVYTQTSIILWPGSSLTPPNGRAVMAGITLRVAVYEVPPFTMIKNEIDAYGQSQTKYIGYVPDLIDLLKNKMGFIPEIVMTPSNQSYNGLIDAIANGMYDMVVADVTVTAARRERVAFSNSIFDTSLRIITRKKTDEGMDLTSFLRPLSIKLWIVLLIATICAGLLICLFERQENDALANRSIIGSSAMSIWYSFGNVVGYGADFDVTTAAGRLVTVGLYMLSLVIVATYTANLASDLTTSKTKDIISGLDDIKNGKLLYSRIGIVANSAIESFYLREISQQIRNFYPVRMERELYTNLINNIIDAAIMDAGVLEYQTSSFYCNLTLVGADFEKGTFAIVLPKGWLYAENLDISILSLRESGELDTLKRKWFQGTTCAGSSEPGTGTTIESMSGLFVTFTVVIAFALISYIWNTCSGRHNYLLRLLYRRNVLAGKNVTAVEQIGTTSS